MTLSKPLSTVAPAVLLLLLGASFIIRVINLNYNSPFNDEAIYVVVGRLGIFQNDWITYNAISWMAGLPYVYPTITALSYMLGGIVGSRLMNVIFGVFCVKAIYDLVVLYTQKEGKTDYVGALISATILSFSTVSLYVSRLATYDMPSFYFLCLSLYLLLGAETESVNRGRDYFISALTLVMAYFTKIVAGFYVPLVVLFAYFRARKLGKTQLHFWKYYYVLFIILGFGAYALTMIPALNSFLHNQAFHDSAPYSVILGVYWENTSYLVYLAVLGSIGLLFAKKYKQLALLLIGSLWILLIHLGTHRLPTFDKHIYLSVVFLSMLAGTGISSLLEQFSSSLIRNLSYGAVALTLVFFASFSYTDLNRFNRAWPNATKMLSVLNKSVRPGDKVLTEVGAAAILAVYDKNYPFNMTTFDWFAYGEELDAQKGYVRAVRDGYFDIIEIETNDDSNSELRKIISDNLNKHYKQIYSENGFTIYKRLI